MNNLIADAFFEDPDVIKAQDKLLKALNKHQKSITQVRPPQTKHKRKYQKTIDSFSEIRGGKLFYPYIGSGIGHGPFVELNDGSIKYDFINGIGVHHFGHSHPEIIKATLKASLEDTVMQGNLQQNIHSYHFSKTLLKAANAKKASLAHCFLTTSGVMAGENALKLAFQKNHPAHRILAFEHCFCGRTITFSQITDKAAYRTGIPNTIPVDYIPFFDASEPVKSSQRAIRTLKKFLARYPGQYTAMLFELVLGEGGYYDASSDFHRELMDICKENGVAVLVDEVQTFARTPDLFAFQYYKLDKWVDIVWIGKSSQVCATLFTKEFKPKPGFLSQTYTASSTAIAAGNVILDLLLKSNYFGSKGKIMALHCCWKEHIEAIHQRHPDLICGPFGIGVMVAFTVFQGDTAKTTAFIKALFDNGLIAFMAGHNPSRVRFLLPVGVIEPAHIKEAAHIIEKTLTSL